MSIRSGPACCPAGAVLLDCSANCSGRLGIRLPGSLVEAKELAADSVRMPETATNYHYGKAVQGATVIFKELDPFSGSDKFAVAGRRAEEQMAHYLRRFFANSTDVDVLNYLRI